MLDYGQPKRRAVLKVIYRMHESSYQDFLLHRMFRGDVFVAPKTLTSPTIPRKLVVNAPELLAICVRVARRRGLNN